MGVQFSHKATRFSAERLTIKLTGDEMTRDEIIKHIVDNNIIHVDMNSGCIIGARNKKIGYYNNQGREVITYRNGKRYVKILSHRIVAYVKFGDKLFEYETVDHIDGNCKNNHPHNLQLMSMFENQHKAYTEEYPQFGENNFMAKLTEKDVVAIKYNEYNKTLNNKQLAKKYNVTHQSISNIRLGKNWSHI